MSYNHLTVKERVCIEEYLNLSLVKLPKGRFKSTISRELRRNSIDGKYQAINAVKLHEKRRAKCRKPLKLSDSLKEFIESSLHKTWSPEQISLFEA
jgi:IS30 family transposase